MDEKRLVYVDELQSHFVDERGEPSTNWYCIESALENTPTVPAITIEWMDEQIRNYASKLKSTELNALVLVKKMWENNNV